MTRVAALLERVGLGLAFIGLFMVFQPFTHELMYYGFMMVGVGGFIYVYSTYLPRNPSGRLRPTTALRWLVTLVGVVVFFVLLSINLVPSLV